MSDPSASELWSEDSDAMHVDSLFMRGALDSDRIRLFVELLACVSASFKAALQQT